MNSTIVFNEFIDLILHQTPSDIGKHDLQNQVHNVIVANTGNSPLYSS